MKFKTIIIFCLAATVKNQEKDEDWPSSYSMKPYIHVYPPANISTNLNTCTPDSKQNQTCPLFIQLMMSFGGAFTSSGIIPGIQIALDQINARSDILPGYTLHYTLLDSQCERTTSLDAFHKSIQNPPVKIAILGSGCSVATEATAEISHYYNLVQVSCSSSSTELMNRRRFRKHFQVFPASVTLAYGYFAMIHNFGWRKIVLIVEDEFLFTSPMTELKRLLSISNITYTEVKYSPDVDPFTTNPDDRIFVLSMYSPNARIILCKAYNYRRDFKYPRNIFLTNANYHNYWWIGSEEEQAYLQQTFNCEAKDRTSLIPYTLGVIIRELGVLNYSTVSDSEYNGDQIRTLYNSYLNVSKLNLSEDFVYQMCYDSTWILARALNKTLEDLQDDEKFMERLHPFEIGTDNGTFELQDFTYNNAVLADNIFKHLSQTKYKGIVGDISFNENGSRIVDTINIQQYKYQDNKKRVDRVTVAIVYWNGVTDYNFTYLENISMIFPYDIPYDGTVTDQVVTVHVASTVIFTLLAFCGICLAVVCITWNVYFRKKKLVRLTSPNLNTIIGFGAIILYLDIIVFGIPASSSIVENWVCNLEPWLYSIGYSFCYGTILAKMCRVYYIFSHPEVRKKPITDWKLISFVLILVTLDVMILIIYIIIESYQGNLNPSRIPSREGFLETRGIFQVTYHNYLYVCNSRSRYITLGILYGYKTVLQIVALILAISIRKVQIKGLNDAKYIIVAIYVTSIVTAVIIVSTYTLTELLNIYTIVFCLCIFIGTTVVLLLVFIPPMTGLHQDPEGNTIFGFTKKGNGGLSNQSIGHMDSVPQINNVETSIEKK